MIKNLKKIKLLIIFILINNCGFVPIYSKQFNESIKFQEISVIGDENVVFFVENKLNEHKSDTINENKIKANVNYSKVSAINNTKGKTSKYKITISISFDILFNNVIKNININESYFMNSFDDIFEEENYEKNLTKDAVNSIINKLFLQILSS